MFPMAARTPVSRSAVSVEALPAVAAVQEAHLVLGLRPERTSRVRAARLQLHRMLPQIHPQHRRDRLARLPQAALLMRLAVDEAVAVGAAVADSPEARVVQAGGLAVVVLHQDAEAAVRQIRGALFKSRSAKARTIYRNWPRF